MSETKILPYVHRPEYDTHRFAIYGNWMLFLNKDQRYLGRSYAWWTGGHIDRMDVSQLPDKYLHDLFKVIAPAFYGAVARLWGATHVNYAWLGNEVEKHQGHGHLHLVPRYFNNIPSFGNDQFPDMKINRNWPLEGGPRLLTDLVLPHILNALYDALATEDATNVRSVHGFKRST